MGGNAARDTIQDFADLEDRMAWVGGISFDVPAAEDRQGTGEVTD